MIRAFCKEKEEIDSFTEDNEQLLNIQVFVGKISAAMNPVTYIIVNAALIAILWTGAVRVDNGIITQGAVVALVNYMSQILVELVKLANLIIQLTKALACAKRIENVLAATNTQKDMNVSSDTDIEKEIDKNIDKDTAILFKNVSLTYQGAGDESLTDIDFKVKKGQTIGIIGGTGSGKSSLVNLIPRFYDATKGAVYIDGQDVKTYDIDTLRSIIGVVPQKAVLYKGTILENLMWGNENASKEDIERALEISQSKEFVDSKEGRLEYKIAQGGKNLSGGQKQRLTIARAIVRNPEILILDDSASALDYATDAKLRKAIKGMNNDMTVIIVSQRASSIMYADQIVVLDDGKMVGVGTHEELLEQNEVYQEIYYSQYPRTDRFTKNNNKIQAANL